MVQRKQEGSVFRWMGEKRIKWWCPIVLSRSPKLNLPKLGRNLKENNEQKLLLFQRLYCSSHNVHYFEHFRSFLSLIFCFFFFVLSLIILWFFFFFLANYYFLWGCLLGSFLFSFGFFFFFFFFFFPHQHLKKN